MIWAVEFHPDTERARHAGEAIRKAREAKGLSQTELARGLTQALRGDRAPGRARTVSQPAVSRWELGENVPEQWKLPVIEECLELPAGTLASVLYDRPPTADRVSELESRIGAFEAKLDQVIVLLHGLDRRIRDT